MGVEPTNAVCAPCTATSDIHNHYTIKASPKKDAQVAYIRTPDAAVHSLYGFYINYFSVQNYDLFLSSVAATLVFFDHSGDIIHINISTSVGVEPTNAACTPSQKQMDFVDPFKHSMLSICLLTATSDVLNHYTIKASPKRMLK